MSRCRGRCRCGPAARSRSGRSAPRSGRSRRSSAPRRRRCRTARRTPPRARAGGRGCRVPARGPWPSLVERGRSASHGSPGPGAACARSRWYTGWIGTISSAMKPAARAVSLRPGAGRRSMPRTMVAGQRDLQPRPRSAVLRTRLSPEAWWGWPCSRAPPPRSCCVTGSNREAIWRPGWPGFGGRFCDRSRRRRRELLRRPAVRPGQSRRLQEGRRAGFMIAVVGDLPRLEELAPAHQGAGPVRRARLHRNAPGGAGQLGTHRRRRFRGRTPPASACSATPAPGSRGGHADRQLAEQGPSPADRGPGRTGCAR